METQTKPAVPTTPVTRSERPLGVAVIAVFLVVDAVMGVGQLAIDTPFMTRIDTLLSITEWAPAGIVVLAILRLVAAVGLWRGSRRAWVLAMLVVGIRLVISFALYWRGDPSHPRMVIDIVIAFYLNQGLVRHYFEGLRHTVPGAVQVPGAIVRRPASRAAAAWRSSYVTNASSGQRLTAAAM